MSIGFQVNCFVLVFPVKSSSASDIPRRKTNLAVNWVREYILFHKKRHPREMGVPEINQFIIHLVVDRKASASTQNQAISAILFLYRNVPRWFGKVRI